MGAEKQITVMKILFIDCQNNKNPTGVRHHKLLGKFFNLEFQSQSNYQSSVPAEFFIYKHSTILPSTSDLKMCSSKMTE